LVAHSYSKTTGLKGTKNNKPREIPVPASILKTLQELVKSCPHDGEWVFWRLDDSTKPLTDKNLEEGFYHGLEAIGIPDDQNQVPKADSRQGRKITFHSLRHSCNALLRGVLPDEKLRLLTGHQSVAMSNHYDHLTDQDRILIARAQEERLFRKNAD
jgi:integrase